MNATPIPPEALAGARAVLDAHRRGTALDDLLMVELSSWLVGAAGGDVALPRNPVLAAHARLAAAAGAADAAAVGACLDARLSTDEGAMLLSSASELVGLHFPDLLVEVAHRHPARPFVGRMLATTSAPDRLLDLVTDRGHLHANAIETVGELVIAGRDSGKPRVRAEQRWAEIAAARPDHQVAFRDVALRLAVRDSLDDAVVLLEAMADEWGRDLIGDGARAVVARLVRADPERAAALVGRPSRLSQRAAWLEGLAWWLELTPHAVPLVHDLIEGDDPDVHLAVARVLTRTPELDLLEGALQRLAGRDPTELAGSLAPGIYQLRNGGRLDVAERVRMRCRDALPREGPAVDAFEVIAGPGPAMVPWAAPAGVP